MTACKVGQPADWDYRRLRLLAPPLVLGLIAVRELVIAAMYTGDFDVAADVRRDIEQARRYGINGVPFWKAQAYRAPLGETQLWVVKNDTVWDHPFHLHGYFFMVVDEKGRFVLQGQSLRVGTEDVVGIFQGGDGVIGAGRWRRRGGGDVRGSHERAF